MTTATRARAWRIGLSLVVLVVAGVAAWLIATHRPTATHGRPAGPQGRLVRVHAAQPAPDQVRIDAHGTVEAADATTLRARVSGRISALTDKLAPGTRFERGDVLARIDPSDYRLALKKAQTDLSSARAALRIEQGRQAVAKRELSLVDTPVSKEERDLALRGPQLQQAKAKVAAAENAVAQARLSLRRTRVTAPFDGIVIEREASVGDVVGSSDSLARFAATSAWWVDVSLPVDQLRWLHAARGGRAGSRAAIHYPGVWAEGVTLPGEVLRIQPSLEKNGRMARVLLRVPDPIGAGAPDNPPLLLGAYVTAHIAARVPAGSVMIRAASLRANNQVWVMTPQGRLAIRSVTVGYRDADRAIITAGLRPGEAVVTSELTGPIEGMALRTVAAGEGNGDAAATTSRGSAHD